MVDVLAKVLDRLGTRRQVHAVVLYRAGERGLCAGGDIVAIYHSARAAAPRPQVLVRRVPAERADRAVPQAVCGADGRHRDGRRRRSQRARQRPRRHRHDEDGHARGRHRLHPRRRWHLPVGAGARSARPARRAHGRTVLRRRRHRDGVRRSLCAARRARRLHGRLVADGVDAALAAHAIEPPRALFWPNGTGSTNASPAIPSPTSSPHCAATTPGRPTTPPT